MSEVLFEVFTLIGDQNLRATNTVHSPTEWVHLRFARSPADASGLLFNSRATLQTAAASVLRFTRVTAALPTPSLKKHGYPVASSRFRYPTERPAPPQSSMVQPSMG